MFSLLALHPFFLSFYFATRSLIEPGYHLLQTPGSFCFLLLSTRIVGRPSFHMGSGSGLGGQNSGPNCYGLDKML